MKISNCELDFVRNALLHQNKRLDGRLSLKGRSLKIHFGEKWGDCLTSLGNTIVLAHVSAEVTEPRSSNPTEGILYINLDLDTMLGPELGINRSASDSVEPQRSLERCIRDSKCVDLESLCIVAASKVWTIRVDLRVLNNDGNFLECASIAAVAALGHFKRPEISVVGNEVKIYDPVDKTPIPLNLHHMPITITLALFDEGRKIIVDPTDIEEKAADGCYIIAMNAHQEICSVHRKGVMLLTEDTVEKCESVAVTRAQKITQDIRAALEDDSYKRATNAPVGFLHLLQSGTILNTLQLLEEFNLNSNLKNMAEPVSSEESDEEEVAVLSDEGKRPAKTTKKIDTSVRERAMKVLKGSEKSMFEGGSSKWKIESDEEEESSSEEEESADESLKESPSANVSSVSVKPEKDSSSEEEEEETAFIESDQIDVKPATSRGWYTKSSFA